MLDILRRRRKRRDFLTGLASRSMKRNACLSAIAHGKSCKHGSDTHTNLLWERRCECVCVCLWDWREGLIEGDSDRARLQSMLSQCIPSLTLCLCCARD